MCVFQQYVWRHFPLKSVLLNQWLLVESVLYVAVTALKRTLWCLWGFEVFVLLCNVFLYSFIFSQSTFEF